MAKSIKCVLLTDKKSPLFKKVLDWNYNWWGKPRGRTLEFVQTYMENSLCRDRLPQTYVILDGKTPVASFQLTMYDLLVRPDIYPWLAKVIVAPEHRGKGYGLDLLRCANEKAREMGIKELYLITQLEGFYEKGGWEFVEQTPNCKPDGAKFDSLYVLKIQ